MMLPRPVVFVVGLVTVLAGALLTVLPLLLGAASERRALFWVGLPFLVLGFLIMRFAVRPRPVRH